MTVTRIVRVVMALSALALPALAAGGTAPRVRVLELAPKVVVRGTSFLPREHLLVRLTGRGISSKRVVANAEGAFRVSLIPPEPRSCGRYLLQVRRPAAKPVTVRIGPLECADPGGGAGS